MLPRPLAYDVDFLAKFKGYLNGTTDVLSAFRITILPTFLGTILTRGPPTGTVFSLFIAAILAAERTNQVKSNQMNEAPRSTAPVLLLTPRDAAKALAISPRKLWSMTAGGEIPCTRIGRAVRYSVAELQAWVGRGVNA